MSKQLENTIVNYARKYFKENKGYQADNEGNLSYEVYTDYSDELDEYTINEAFEKCDGNIEEIKEYLYEHIWECYIDYIADMENELCREVEKYITEKADTQIDLDLVKEGMLDTDTIRDILVDNSVLLVYVNYDDILNRSNVDLIISLESDVSKDHEFTLNNFNGDVLEWIEETKESIENGDLEHSDLSIVRLLMAQGSSFKDFEHEAIRYFNESNYRPSNRFMKSLLDECYNTTSMCNALIFLTNMSLGEYLNGESIKTIKKGTPCGYVDFVYGGGSTVSVVLEKDIQLSAIEHEKFIDNSKGNKYGYSFKEIYGEFIR